MYKIGYVDENPQEVIKFERKLRDNFDLIGYDIPKGIGKDQLLDQIYDSKVDFLMVDFLMRDKGHVTFNGDEIVRDYEHIMPRFPMIIFTNNKTDAFPAVDTPNIIYEKDIINSDKPYLIQMIEKNILNYQAYISERKNRILELIEKRESKGLDSKEKEELFSCQLDLNNLDNRSKQTPGFLVNDLKLDKLRDTTNEAEEFLNSLINDNDDSSTAENS